MFNTLKKRVKNEKGLSLVELLAVIVIMAIIAAIAIPAIGNIINNSRDKAVLSDAAGLLSGAKIAIVDGACGAAASNVITCNKAALTNVFEGTLADTDQVTYNTSTKVYTVTYGKLNTIKNTTKFTGEGYTPPATSITEKQLITVMGQ